VTVGESNMNVVVFRLSPGADLKQALSDYCVEHAISAACVISCVGSLRCARIRFADRDESMIFEEKLEIVSLAGMLSQHGCHLHIVVSDGQGTVSGGHLMADSHIYTTAEIVLGIISGIIFKREHDEQTGYKELKIEDQGLE
jgi:predicted DNA-binding protein with PD1-like motif